MSTPRLSESVLLACLALSAADARAAPPFSPSADATSPASPQRNRGSDPLAEYRERFKLGMDRYKAGALREAIGYWEPVYRELGPREGYRLAYDLGVAYAELGDATHAAQRLQSFLDELAARRARTESLAAIISKEEADARSRLAGLVATKGRIRVEPGTPPRAAQVDTNEPRVDEYVAWVSPGDHAVTFAPGTREMETKTVRVNAGEIVEVAPSAPPAAPETKTPAAIPVATSASLAASGSSPHPPPHVAYETVHPFAPAVIYVSGGLAIVAAVAAIPLETHASALHDRFVSENGSGSIPSSDRSTFSSARTEAYVAVGSAIGLSVLTAGLATWYVLATSQRELPVTPTVGAAPDGATVGMSAAF